MNDTKKSWDGDLLNREAEALFLKKHLTDAALNPFRSHNRKSVVLNLKAPWGAGKTFFLENFGSDLESAGHLVVYWDAWKADPDLDPIVSLVAALRTELEQHADFNMKTSEALRAVYRSGGSFVGTLSKNIARRVLQAAIGKGVDEVEDEFLDMLSSYSQINLDELDGFAEDSVDTAVDGAVKGFALSGYFAKQMKVSMAHSKAINSFNRDMTSLVEKLHQSKKNHRPTFIFIDELDRCSPTFAIKVLERVNHLFDIDGCVFVISTDTDQLVHTINAVYGSNFDSYNYMHRFFDLTYQLNEGSLEQIFNLAVRNHSIDFSNCVMFGNQNAESEIRRIVCELCPTSRSVKHVMQMLSSYLANAHPKVLVDGILLTIFAIGLYYGQQSSISFSSRAPGQRLEKNEFTSKLEKYAFTLRVRGVKQPYSLVKYVDEFREFMRQNLGHLANMAEASGPSPWEEYVGALAISEVPFAAASPNQAKPSWMEYEINLRTASRLTGAR